VACPFTRRFSSLYGREAAAYVQSFGLKAVAVVSVRLLNSRSPENSSLVTFSFGRKAVADKKFEPSETPEDLARELRRMAAGERPYEALSAMSERSRLILRAAAERIMKRDS